MLSGSATTLLMYIWSLLIIMQLAPLYAKDPVLIFPLQFTATLQITAHLIPEGNDFPPRYKRMSIYYDYIKKKARADIEAGFEAAKYYIRRYDKEHEYMVRLPPISDCKRNPMLEEMPFPEVSDVVYAGDATVNGVDCNYFLHEDFTTRVHMYMAKSDGAPVSLVEENTDNDESTLLLTYDFTDVTLGSPDASWFELEEPYQHTTCARHSAGFPYLHIFHHFVKF